MNIINNGCDFCKDHSLFYTDDCHLSIELKNGKLLLETISSCRCGAFETEIKINYCPMCGNKLN